MGLVANATGIVASPLWESGRAVAVMSGARGSLSVWAAAFWLGALIEQVGRGVWKDYPGLEVGGFLGSHLRVGHYDNNVAHLTFAGGCSVEADVA